MHRQRGFSIEGHSLSVVWIEGLLARGQERGQGWLGWVRLCRQKGCCRVRVHALVGRAEVLGLGKGQAGWVRAEPKLYAEDGG